MAEQHQVIDVVARLEEETAHGRVGDDILGEDDGTHVELHELLDIFHLLVEWQLHVGEDLGHHFGAFELMAVEGPARAVLPAFGEGLGDVVKQGSPAQPEVVALFGHLVEHL